MIVEPWNFAWPFKNLPPNSRMSSMKVPLKRGGRGGFRRAQRKSFLVDPLRVLCDACGLGRYATVRSADSIQFTSLASSRARTSGHSSLMILKTTESRTRPLGMII